MRITYATHGRHKPVNPSVHSKDRDILCDCDGQEWPCDKVVFETYKRELTELIRTCKAEVGVSFAEVVAVATNRFNHEWAVQHGSVPEL